MKFKRENKGFSLVELIVVIAIFSVVSVVVGGFLFAASRSYSINANELNLQDEAQLVANQMQEMILDTSYGISYKYVVTDDTGAEIINFLENEATLPAGDLAKKDLFIYGKDQYYHITWDKEEQKLYLMEYVKLPGATDYTPAEGMETLAPKGVMFGQYIKDFTVDLTKVASNRMVSFNILFEKTGSNRDYLVARNVSLRNDVMTNKETLDMYAAAGIEIQPKADILEVVPNAPVTLWPGESQQYRATLICSKGGVPSQSVTWDVASLDGVLHADTKVNSSALFTVSPEETSSEIKLDVYADGYNYTTNAEEEIRPSGADLTVNVRQITGLEITENNFEDEGFPITKGGTYKIKVRMDGKNLPSNVTDAGGIIAQVTVGDEYADVTEMTVDGMIAEFTVQISDTAPEDGEIALSFKPAKTEFSHKVKTTPVYKFTGASAAGLKVKKADEKPWLRLGNVKTQVQFADTELKDTICKSDGTLKNGYSIRYTYEIYEINEDGNPVLNRTVTSTIGATTAAVTDPNFITGIKHSSVYEAEATLSDKLSLRSGSVVVSAELIHNTGGTAVVVSNSNSVSYVIEEAVIGFKKAQNDSSKTNMKVYITKDNNTAPIYIDFTGGFATDNYKVSLEQAVIDNTTLGSVSSSLSDTSKNLITVVGDKNAEYKSSSSSPKKLIFTYGGLSNKVEIYFVKANVSSTNYFVPIAPDKKSGDLSEWKFIKQEKKKEGSGWYQKTVTYDYYSYYIDDTHRMDIRYKDGSFNSAEYCYYVNMAEKKVAYTKGTNSWNIK